METVNELTKAAYERALRSRNRAETTIDGYLWWIDDLAGWLDHTDVLMVEQPDLEDYMGWLLAELASASAASAFRALRAFYNWAVKEELIEASPMRKMECPKIDDEPPPMADDDSVRALLKACSGRTFEERRDTAIIRLFCEAGSPRVSEMASIELAALRMRDNKVGFWGKGAKWREIPFGVRTGTALDWYLRVRATHRLARLPHLWIGQRGKQLTASGIQQMLERRSQQAGLTLTVMPHMLRHRAYHTWKEAGGDPADGEQLWGWSENSRMDRVYGRQEKRSRAEKAARRLSIADRL